MSSIVKETKKSVQHLLELSYISASPRVGSGRFLDLFITKHSNYFVNEKQQRENKLLTKSDSGT